MNKYNWSNKEVIITDLKKCVSIADFLKQKNLYLTSGNYSTFKSWIKKHNINPQNYFLPKNKIIKIKKVTEITYTVEDLCVNSTISQKQLKTLIKNNQLLKYECSCGNPGVWNGNPLTLQLEHKNGNNTDNRLENLEYLCPNCHAQTVTYGSKNSHNRIFEKRLEDIKKFNGKKLNAYDYNDLAKEWNSSVGSVENWIRQYKEKLIEAGISFEKTIAISDTEKIKELSKYSYLTDDNKLFLAKKWDISLAKLEQWVKNNLTDLYLNSYKCSKNHLIKINQIKLKENVDKIIKNDNLKTEEKNKILLDLFKGNKSSLKSYIKKYNIRVI